MNGMSALMSEFNRPRSPVKVVIFLSPSAVGVAPPPAGGRGVPGGTGGAAGTTSVPAIGGVFTCKIVVPLPSESSGFSASATLLNEKNTAPKTMKPKKQRNRMSRGAVTFVFHSRGDGHGTGVQLAESALFAKDERGVFQHKIRLSGSRQRRRRNGSFARQNRDARRL